MNRYNLFIIVVIVGNLFSFSQTKEISNSRTANFGNKFYKKSSLLHNETFKNLDNWVVEQQQGGSVELSCNALNINDKKGTTAWFNKELSSPVLIEYNVVIHDNKRISDMNCFWMAIDPKVTEASKKANIILGQRSGRFKEYDNLKMYYVGCGAHNNTKTRLRRYNGNGKKPLQAEHDLNHEKYLLQPNKTYLIKIIVLKNRVQYFRDDVCFYDFTDPEPLQTGWFGFRIYNSHQTFNNFRVYKLKDVAK